MGPYLGRSSSWLGRESPENPARKAKQASVPPLQVRQICLEEPEAKSLVDDPAHGTDRRVDRLLGGDESDPLDSSKDGLRSAFLHIEQHGCFVLRNLSLSTQFLDLGKGGC